MKNNCYFFLIILFGITFSSCIKEPDPITSQDTSDVRQTGEDHSLVDSEFNAIFNTVDNVANADSTIKSAQTVLPSCASKTFDVATKTLVVNFGSTNCLCADGISRRGVITAVFNGKYRTVGTTVTITLTDYFANDIEFKGRKTIENLGDGSGNFKYKYEVRNAEAITTSGTIRWQTDATIERTAGDDTFTPWDDIYEAVGSSQGVNRNGNSFTVNVNADNPLIRKISLNPLCWRSFVSGIVTVTDDIGNLFVIDYDPENEGECDNEAQLSINGRDPITIFLR